MLKEALSILGTGAVAAGGVYGAIKGPELINAPAQKSAIVEPAQQMQLTPKDQAFVDAIDKVLTAQNTQKVETDQQLAEIRNRLAQQEAAQKVEAEKQEAERNRLLAQQQAQQSKDTAPVIVQQQQRQENTQSQTQDSGSAESFVATAFARPAKRQGDMWTLHNSDGADVLVNLAGAEGFTPDADLKTSDIAPKALGALPADAGDFQAYLNKPREGFGPLAGYTDGTNDYNQFKDHQSGPQVPVYSWMVHTGLNVELPGIGRVEGGPGRAAMVLILNRTERVYRFPTNSVKVEAGFQGFGRIWDGNPDPLQETEKRLTNHYRSRLGSGVPETGFIGQCDQAANNCDTITVVAVERMQWGNNPDGTPRDQFRLIRAETVSAK